MVAVVRVAAPTARHGLTPSLNASRSAARAHSKGAAGMGAADSPNP